MTGLTDEAGTFGVEGGVEETAGKLAAGGVVDGPDGSVMVVAGAAVDVGDSVVEDGTDVGTVDVDDGLPVVVGTVHAPVPVDVFVTSSPGPGPFGHVPKTVRLVPLYATVTVPPAGIVPE